MSLKKIFFLLIVLSPFFWWQILNSKNVIFLEYFQIPLYIKNKTSSILKKTQQIDEFRWNDITKDNRPLVGRIFYNKSYLIINEFMVYLNILNPRFYFQSGSGQTDSPPNVEPIAILLLPCSFLGLFSLIKKSKFKILLVGIISCILGYFTGHYSIYFLFPTSLFYLYTSAYEISHWTKKHQIYFLSSLAIYSLFLFFRVIYINNL